MLRLAYPPLLAGEEQKSKGEYILTTPCHKQQKVIQTINAMPKKGEKCVRLNRRKHLQSSDLSPIW